MRNIKVLGFGVMYIKDLMVYLSFQPAYFQAFRTSQQTDIHPTSCILTEPICLNKQTCCGDLLWLKHSEKAD